MRALRSLSDWFSARSRRERVFLAAGATIVAAVLAMSYAILPLAERWSAREAAYAAASGQWSRLQSVVADEARLRRALQDQKRYQRGALDLLLTGTSPALAASSLQALLQQYAVESLVQLNRVDIAGQTRPAAPGLLAIPVVLQGHGDIHGLADFLTRMQEGRKLVVVNEISISLRSSWSTGDQPLVWSVRAYGLYPAPAGRT